MKRKDFLKGCLALGVLPFLPKARELKGDDSLMHYDIYCSSCGHIYYDKIGKPNIWLDNLVQDGYKYHSYAGRLKHQCLYCSGWHEGLIVRREYVCQSCNFVHREKSGQE